MVLITVLTLILLILVVVLLAAISTIGAGAIIIFADVIVCALFIGWVISKLRKKKQGVPTWDSLFAFAARTSPFMKENRKETITMMKFIRGLYVAVFYAIGLPILFVITLIGGVWLIIKTKIDGYSDGVMNDIKEFGGAWLYGLQQGHKVNMHFVKYGRNGYDHLGEL